MLADQMRRRLFYYDIQRPLGTLLLEQRNQKWGDWNQYAGGPLREALQKAKARSELENEAWSFLKPKLREPDPITKFMAYQSWSWYHKYRDLQGNTDMSQEFADDFLGLNNNSIWQQDVFYNYGIWERDYDIMHTWERVLHNVNKNGRLIDRRLDIRYSAQNGGEEWLVVCDSFYPTLQYYLKKLMDWKLCYCKCNICGRMFLAPSRHYSLCNEACRAEQNRQNKRQFDARAKENGYDIDYKNTCQRMRNRLNQLKNQKGISDEKCEVAQTRFEMFWKEALMRKNRLRMKRTGRFSRIGCLNRNVSLRELAFKKVLDDGNRNVQTYDIAAMMK